MAQTKYFLYKWWVRENDTLYYCLAVEVDKRDNKELADQMILASQTETAAILALQSFLKGEPNRLKEGIVVREFASIQEIQWAIAHGA